MLAPSSARPRVIAGAAITRVRSTTFRPARGRVGEVLVDGEKGHQVGGWEGER